jgi:hypothetical protein
LIGVDDESVQMAQFISTNIDVVVDEMVLSLVGDDSMSTTSTTANIRAKHNVVFGVTVEGSLVQTSRQNFHIPATTVNVLLVFDGELEDKILTLVAEFRESSAHLVKASVFQSLQTNISLRITMKFASGKTQLPSLSAFVC